MAALAYWYLQEFPDPPGLIATVFAVEWFLALAGSFALCAAGVRAVLMTADQASGTPAGSATRQFSLRELLLLVTCSAVVLAIVSRFNVARLAGPNLVVALAYGVAFGVLSVAALLAAWLVRRTALAVILLLVVALGFGIAVGRLRGGGPFMAPMIALCLSPPLFQATGLLAWRQLGYQLTRARASEPTAEEVLPG